MVRRTFGNVRRRASGRWQARYELPGGQSVGAPTTFGTRAEADAWLARKQTELEEARAASPRAMARRRAPVLKVYAAEWIADRRTKDGPLRPSTRVTYEGYLRRHIAPSPLGCRRLDEITPADVRAWYKKVNPGHPTGRARVYAMLRTVFKTAVDEDLVDSNPCRIVGGGRSEPATEVVVVTPAQVARLAEEMGPSAAAVYLGAYCQLRVGEVLALRRCDVDLDARTVSVSRAASWIDGRSMIGPPKTKAGIRVVSIPGPAVGPLRDHLADVPKPPGSLLFPGRTPGSPPATQAFSDRVKRAAHRADLPAEFRFHWLRHTGLTLLAEAGATVAELQARAGHTTPTMALKYQHARAERDRDLADRLTDLVERKS